LGSIIDAYLRGGVGAKKERFWGWGESAAGKELSDRFGDDDPRAPSGVLQRRRDLDSG